MAHALEDLTRPPFAVCEGLGPPEVAIEMVAAFERIAARADAMGHAHALAMESAGVEAGDPMYSAGAAIARDMDRGVGVGVSHGYHNARHFLEVLLCALYLARIANLPAARAARVLTAALIHDFHHDGSRSTDSPFRLEKLALAKAGAYFERAAVPALAREQIGALVLATEPKTGIDFARACFEHATRGEPAPAGTGIPAPLGRLAGDAQLSFEAVLLAEADVLPSIGLTVEHGETVHDSLAAEWNSELGPQDKVEFVDRVCDSIEIGRFFLPNIVALRHAFAQRLNERR